MDLDSISHWVANGVWVEDRTRESHVEYFEVGDPADPILLFIHGWGLSPTSYRRPINALADDGWYVIAPTLPGFGKSTPLRGKAHVVEGIADHFTAAMQEIGVTGTHPVVAHSLGCGVAAEMVIRGFPNASSLTLVCPIGAAGSAATSWAQMMLGLRREIGKDTAERIADALPNIVRHPVAVATSGFAAKAADLIEDFSTIAEGMPVHIILADDDGVIARHKLPTLYTMTGVKVTNVPGTHGWMLTSPRALPPLVDQTQLMVVHQHSTRT